MIASTIIGSISLVLFLYWFRYTCILILNTNTTRDYAKQVASANQLSFLEARVALSDAGTQDASFQNERSAVALDHLHRSLERDYRLLTYLLRHVASYQPHGQSFEHQLLVIDYHVMRVWYRIVRSVSSRHASRALLEIASILNHLANAMGEQVAVSFKA